MLTNQSLHCLSMEMDLEIALIEHSLALPFFGILGFPSGLDGKASVCNAEDPGSIPGLERSPGSECK